MASVPSRRTRRVYRLGLTGRIGALPGGGWMAEPVPDLVRGVGVNLQFGRERANRWKGLAGLKLAADKRFRGRKDDLVEDG